MELKEATKQLNKTKEIFEHLKYRGWITDIKRDVDASDVIDAIDTVLAELDTLQMNYTLLEEKFDGSAEEKVDKLTAELDKQKQVKAEMRKVAWEEGYNQGYLAGAMESI